MATIGYNASGYNDLAAEIRLRKNNLLDILNSFPEVENAIADAWKGEDATAYCDALAKVINSTKETVSETYDAMAYEFEKTYNDWIEKQRASGNI
ncbi:MAG: hypothetical protein ACI4U4_01690 [Bacilli bacterium]